MLAITIIMLFLNFVLFMIGGYISFEFLSHPSRFSAEILLIVAVCYLSVPSAIYLGYFLVLRNRLPAEHIVIPLPNDNYEKLRRRTINMSYVNLVYAASLLTLLGFMVYGFIQYLKFYPAEIGATVVAVLVSLAILAYAIIHIWHVFRFRSTP